MKKIKLRKQNTLDKSSSFGSGTLHNGDYSKITIYPAEADNGIIFKYKNSDIKASLENASAEGNMMRLSNGREKIYCTEHLLSAINSMEVDNCIIELEGCNEIAWGDGSSRDFAEMISEAGIKPQKKYCYAYRLSKKIRHADSMDKNRFIEATPVKNNNNNTSILCEIHFDNIIGKQKFLHSASRENFMKDIAGARSFFSSDIDTAKNQMKKFAGFKKYNVISYSKKEFLTELRYKDECARHKLLDFMGDFSLLGHRIIADFHVSRGGHKLHLAFARKLSEEMRLDEKHI